MRRPAVILLAAVALALTSCAKKEDTSSAGNADTTAAQAPDTSVHGEMLVTTLPAEIEGLELVPEGLRVKKGYDLVPQPDSTIAVRRLGDGRQVAFASCGCRLIDLGCIPMDQGGILVCTKLLCSPCGLRITAGGKEFDIARYQKVLN